MAALCLTGAPLVMGVLNITPDSFSDGGSLFDGRAPKLDAVLRRAEQMISSGVGILDVGGESTRPQAKSVSTDEELARVLPVLEALHSRFDTPISVDTSNPELMRAACDYDIALINDVRALQRPGALQAAVHSGAHVCLMHMRGEPQSMQDNPEYADVVEDVSEFLLQRAAAALSAGVQKESILLDPGFGFGKTLLQNLQLFRALPRMQALGYPLLVGISRKSMIGAILDKNPDQRVAGGLAFATLAAWQGVAIIRTHDVADTRDVLEVVRHLQMEKE